MKLRVPRHEKKIPAGELRATCPSCGTKAAMEADMVFGRTYHVVCCACAAMTITRVNMVRGDVRIFIRGLTPDEWKQLKEHDPDAYQHWLGAKAKATCEPIVEFATKPIRSPVVVYRDEASRDAAA